MFELTEETRNNVIAVLRESLPVDSMTDDELSNVIDEVVNVVKKQFGM